MMPLSRYAGDCLCGGLAPAVFLTARPHPGMQPERQKSKKGGTIKASQRFYLVSCEDMVRAGRRSRGQNQHLTAAHTVKPVAEGAKNKLTTSITFLALVIGALDT